MLQLSLATRSLSKYVLAGCVIYVTTVLLDISPNLGQFQIRSGTTKDAFGGYQHRRALSLSLSELPSLEDASFMYEAIFTSDPTPEFEEIQKQIRIGRDCTPELEAHYDLKSHQFPTRVDHPDSQVGIISCKPVHYRVPAGSTQNIQEPIVFGVLSGAKENRDSIRKTWGLDKAVFFLVAGPWEGAIEEEYNTHQDLIWIDQPEIYRNDPGKPITEGALTFKTETFLLAAHNQIMKNSPNVKYFFKTDDDCYVDVNGLSTTLLKKSEHETVNYWGQCIRKAIPYRNEHTRWYVSWKDYPFSYYPDFCIGSGYVMSSELMKCMIGEGHIEKVRYLTNEDGAVGLLAERCGVVPASFSTGGHIPTVLDFNKNDIKSTVVQHGIKKEEDMIAVHEHVMRLRN